MVLQGHQSKICHIGLSKEYHQQAMVAGSSLSLLQQKKWKCLNKKTYSLSPLAREEKITIKTCTKSSIIKKKSQLIWSRVLFHPTTTSGANQIHTTPNTWRNLHFSMIEKYIYILKRNQYSTITKILHGKKKKEAGAKERTTIEIITKKLHQKEKNYRGRFMTSFNPWIIKIKQKDKPSKMW